MMWQEVCQCVAAFLSSDFANLHFWRSGDVRLVAPGVWGEWSQLARMLAIEFEVITMWFGFERSAVFMVVGEQEEELFAGSICSF